MGKQWLWATVLIGSASLWGSGNAAIAQVESIGDEPVELETLPDAFLRNFTFSSQDAYSTTATIGRQLDFLFGIAGFPESEISRDGHLVNQLYEETLRIQYSLGPVIRTPDLTSPYQSSLRTVPSYLGPAGGVLPGDDYWFSPFR